MTSNSDLAEHLNCIGLRRREIMAEWDGVRGDMKSRFPSDVVGPLIEGLLPPKGLGIIGDTGTGKTMALAALVKQNMKVRYRDHLASGTGDFLPKIKWVCWPETVAFIRSNATSPDVEQMFQGWEETMLLVLDDLGRERIKGAYAEDWATNQLDRIITSRNRRMLPILWSTNVSIGDLSSIYGAAMLSRLLEGSYLVHIEGANQRLTQEQG